MDASLASRQLRDREPSRRDLNVRGNAHNVNLGSGVTLPEGAGGAYSPPAGAPTPGTPGPLGQRGDLKLKPNDSNDLSLSTPVALALVTALTLVTAACGARQKKDETVGPEGGIAGNPNLVDRPRCVTPERTVETVDVDGDGQPNVRHALEGERRVCTELDLNFDSKMDVTRFYEEDGETPEREEYDYDFDGLIDEVLTYEGGALVKRELDTNFDHRVDTWILCQAGYVIRVERDRRMRGKPDVFEDYEDGFLTVAAYDEDLDGTPERFEFFEDGRIVETGVDTTGDGEADERTRVSVESAGPALERALCEAGQSEEAE
jgi:hypothetical protein